MKRLAVPAVLVAAFLATACAEAAKHLHAASKYLKAHLIHLDE